MKPEPGTGVPSDLQPTLLDSAGATSPQGLNLDKASRVGTKVAHEPPFPVANWDRYVPVRLLGQGGMGTVFLVNDLKLHRQVALKFVRGDNSRHTAQLLTEARAQARVSHERVCKVFDVGEVQGQVYIAMQFIAGQPLSVAARELSFEQRAMVIRDAAEGVHEAHRSGIIHRDLKPGNIMVERGEEGELKVFVMDFGIARDPTSEEIERTGSVMGTPQFMAPEQARGEVARLDRRADVYGLGATLYQILCGRSPIPGTNNLEILSNIATVEPPPLRTLDKDIPADLQAITGKCLEKDRSARYDSARALLEDIDRFLNGEPVQASRAGAWYRLRKRARKHRRLVIAGTAAALLLALALGWALKTRNETAQRVRLASQFSERVEQVEALARYSALSRIHDIREDRAKILARMQGIEAEIAAAGPLAAGPGAYAIGRGYLALGDDAKARDALESAWKQGFQVPRTAYTLALVFGHLYQRELLEAERIKNDAIRSRRKKEVEAKYRDPALGYLRQAGGADVPSKEYVAALIAYYEGRLDQALQHLDAIGERLPWFYEAPQLRGDVLFARAIGAFRQGDRDRARIDLAAAQSAYEVACSVAESVPRVWDAAGAVEYQALVMELYGEGDVKPHFERGIMAADRALTALPDDVDSLVLSAQLNRRMAEDISQHGGNAEEYLAKAIKAASAAPSASLSARLELIRGHSEWGQYLQDKNLDPREQLTKAEALLDALLPAERDYETQLQDGLVAQTWADYEDQIGSGSNSDKQRTRAIEAYLGATKFDQQQPAPWINLASCYLAHALEPNVSDPDAELAKAADAVARARALDPGHFVPFFLGGQIFTEMAKRARARGLDPRPDLERALKLSRDGIALNSRDSHLHNGAGVALLELATEAWDRGKDPEPLIAEARAAFEAAAAVAPDQGYSYHNLCEAWTRLAVYASDRGTDPEPMVQKAVAMEQKAIQSIAEYSYAWANLALAHVTYAEFEADHGRDPSARLNLALTSVKKALEKNPRDPEAHFAQGRAIAVRARWLAHNGSSGCLVEFQSALREFQKAIELSPELPNDSVKSVRLCQEWALALNAQGQDPAPPLKRGLDLAEALLKQRPEWPDTLVLRGSLWLTSARMAITNDERGKNAARAVEDFTKALAANPNLQTVWGKELAAARKFCAQR